MKTLQKAFIVLSLALVTVVGASAQNRDRNDRRDNRDRDNNRQEQNDRWRVRRSGRYYNVNQNQAEILRQAVNAGYQQGYQAGRDQRQSRRRSSYNSLSVYRQGTYGYQNGVDRSLYQYYFQQGFQKGYDDGVNSRFRYGRNEGGSVNILGNILTSLLGLQRY
jgi:hypothetical protein